MPYSCLNPKSNVNIESSSQNKTKIENPFVVLVLSFISESQTARQASTDIELLRG